ncbi:Chemoreceptor glutamine deamidase CheD [Planctomycetes bacterium Pan216]|uniref:Probable chemoreceptor glutamine deamidase CheD n=1 Tax=Kolteria novifilia TaxID=2527975 RepID=A0A518BCR4_9BACT|nr:Chemoreceptor glutamine deamidase CheD [Planctomycetes bacterium Pan216]
MAITGAKARIDYESVKIGELAVVRAPRVLRTILGSCIGLALYDGINKVAGLAHIVLPKSNGDHSLPGKFADTAVDALMAAMVSLGAKPRLVRAKIAGGASMFKTSASGRIGTLNAEAVREHLKQANVPLLAEEVGGERGRRMSLFADDGRVLVEIHGTESQAL